jgi:hypothetical protein
MNYPLEVMLHISNTEILKSIYFPYFYSIINHGIIFCGYSSYSKMIFTLQNKIIRLLAGVKSRSSCKNLFKRQEILTLPCECIFSLMIFVLKKQDFFPTNSHIYILSTQGIWLSFIDQLPASHVSKRALIMLALKSSNSLPSNLTTLRDSQVQFKAALIKM